MCIYLSLQYGAFYIHSYTRVVSNDSLVKDGCTFLELEDKETGKLILLKDLDNDNKVEEVIVNFLDPDELEITDKKEADEAFSDLFREVQDFLLDNLLVFTQREVEGSILFNSAVLFLPLYSKDFALC